MWPKYKWYIILGILALVVFVSLYWYSTRDVKTDVPQDLQSSVKKGVAYNPNKDLWLTRATDLSVALKQIDSAEDCKRMVAGICGNIMPAGYRDERTWYDACTCEVVGRICYPAWDLKRKDIEARKGDRVYANAWHVLSRRDDMLARGIKDVLPWP